LEKKKTDRRRRWSVRGSRRRKDKYRVETGRREMEELEKNKSRMEGRIEKIKGKRNFSKEEN
jgi:hypothetical protein